MKLVCKVPTKLVTVNVVVVSDDGEAKDMRQVTAVPLIHAAVAQLASLSVAVGVRLTDAKPNP